MERFDLRNRRRIKGKQGEGEAERAVEPACVMRDRRVRRKMRKTKTKQKFTTSLVDDGEQEDNAKTGDRRRQSTKQDQYQLV